MRGKLIAITAHLRKEKKEQKKLLRKNIQKLEAAHTFKGSKKTYQALLRERKVLETLETTEIQRKLLQVKQQSWHKTPRSLKLLAWRIQKRKETRQMHMLKEVRQSI